MPVDINECASSPCQNEGSCVDQVNAYTCICQDGYTGTHCETDVDECACDPCQNGGSCVDQVNSYWCNCLNNNFGIHCESVCSTVLLNGQSGTFTSPNHPNQYQNDMDCTWQITVQSNYVIQLTFSNFSLEASFDCVDILEGTTDLGGYCGQKGPGTVTSSSNTVTVRFTSDESVSGTGFSASYVASFRP
ncbi:delta-like protein D [Littorina saxatilis]|uniref:delta-like protein D n=1 Tax=Littorina saxatilis TaxID=31220 RepID=UPI0038B65D83